MIMIHDGRMFRFVPKTVVRTITASGSTVTRVCHCVLLWVLDISQDGRDEQGRNKRPASRSRSHITMLPSSQGANAEWHRPKPGFRPFSGPGFVARLYYSLLALLFPGCGKIKGDHTSVERVQ